MYKLTDLKYKELFSKEFWQASDFDLLNCDKDSITLGNKIFNPNQTQIKFIEFNNTFLPIVLGESILINKINIEIVGLHLCYYKNICKLRTVLNNYLNVIPKKLKLDLTNNLTHLYLNEETRIFKFFLNKENIFNNKVTNNIYCQNKHLKIISKEIKPKQILFNELNEYNSDLTFSDFAEIKDNNIYQVYLNLFKNKNDKCIIKFDFDSKYYPLVPPKIEWISPIISKDNYAALLNSDIFNKSWNPLINLSWLFNQIKEQLIERENKNNDKYFDNKNNKFEKQDVIIMNFAKLIGMFTSSNPIKINFTPIEKKSNKSVWKKGTGYGHNGLNDWSPSNYLETQSNINSQISNYLDNIFKIDKITPLNKKYLFNICLKEIGGLTLLEINKYPELYFKYFHLLSLISCKEYFKEIEYSNDIKNNFDNLVENINLSSDDKNGFFTEIKQIVEKLIPLIEIKSNSNSTEDYCSIMKSLQFNYNNTNNTKYIFKNRQGKPTSTKQMMRIAQEISSLQKNLPLNEESTVWIRWDKEQLNKMQFLISGPKDTPYQDGLFLFDCYFPSNYPQTPPLVLLQTTGGGTVRFNPNLYNSGKVCLSLLGTWSGTAGEKWNKKTSTMLQVLVSIQSLILIEQPYFNEPGFESAIGTETGELKSEQYNQKIRTATSNWAIKDMIQNPPNGFEEIIKNHFKMKKDNIKKMLSHWSNISNDKNIINDALDVVNNFT